MINDSLLDKEILNIDKFFHSLINVELPLPKARISNEIDDAEVSSNDGSTGYVTINPSYLKGRNRISYRALLAHGYFHQVQYFLIGFYKSYLKEIKKGLGSGLNSERLSDLLDNLIESSAMFFAISYITKDLRGSARKYKIIKYLKSKQYMPLNGKFYNGNGVMLLAYSNSHYSINDTVSKVLSPKEAVGIMKIYLDSVTASDKS